MDQSGVRAPDGRRLYAAPCGIRTKWPSGRRTPLYENNGGIVNFALQQYSTERLSLLH